MSQVTLRAQAGRAPGSRESRRIRRDGNVPAVVYGHDIESRPISVDSHDLRVALHTEAGANALINLEIDGEKPVLTMARAIDKHPFRNEYRHVDFVAISLEEKLRVEVNIHFEGTPVGVREGGVFSPRRTTVEVLTLPTTIPDFIELDVSEVELNESLRIADLPDLEGVEYTEDPEAVVMSVTVPAAEIEEPEPEEDLLLEGELPEGEEGEAVEGEEGEEGAEEASEEEAAAE
ncbi:MAG: 50S ribosomal protein L25 [Actinobacteria bacterium]|nr:MAG: 50S ribosomal protein L25 [Actinomycetota bacterium]REK41103.1 MAG: 50S ribosomal protein L25 [Actinomycetota bacterium]